MDNEILEPKLNEYHLNEKSTMTSPAILSASPVTDYSHLSVTKNRIIHVSPILFSYYSKYKKSNLFRSIKSSVSDSIAIIDTPTESEVRNGDRIRVRVPLTVYHIPKVLVDLNGKEGKIKENVAVWKGHHISANFPYKVEFFEKLDGRGDAPVKFFAHLKEDEFDYID